MYPLMSENLVSLVDIPKDVNFASGNYTKKKGFLPKRYSPKIKPDNDLILKAVKAFENAKK